MEKRWIILSNRLPLAVNQDTGEITRSSGGLVTALSGISVNVPIVWIGSGHPGVSKQRLNAALRAPGREISYEPVIIPPSMYDKYYNGMCNDVLWPLLHYESERVRYSVERWKAYRAVNELFAERALSIIRSHDLVWVHDFHLFLVPQFIKAVRPDVAVGFFLHTPFPNIEIFRGLPNRQELVKGLLEADLVGFHDSAYLRHFSNSVSYLLGGEADLLAVRVDGHRTELGVYPVSIDTKDFHRRAASKAVASYASELSKSWSNTKIILGIDRLDYIKGITLRLRAFCRMLELYPEMRGKVSLVQVAVPSRINVPEYADLKAETEQLVGEINGKFGRVNYIPVHYMFQSVEQTELLALYREADLLFISSKRDGMNLVALEYLCCQKTDDPGVVVLSEFTGAHSNLSNAVSVNPWDVEGTARTLCETLNIPKAIRRERHAEMLRFLLSYSASDWAENFMKRLELGAHEHARVGTTKDLNKESEKLILSDIGQHLRKGKRLVLLLSYDGTLAPIVDDPRQAKPSKGVVKILRQLQRLPFIVPIIVSGREKHYLEKNLGTTLCGLVSEYGAHYSAPGGRPWRTLVQFTRSTWYSQVVGLMQAATRRVPGSVLERKQYSIAWHYRRSPKDFAEYQAKKLRYDLNLGLANAPVSVRLANKMVEVKPIEADKTRFLRWLLNEELADRSVQVMVIGQNEDDEPLFTEVNKLHGITVKVGSGVTSANYRLAAQSEITSLLQRVCEISLRVRTKTRSVRNVRRALRR